MKKIVLTGGGTAGHVNPNIALMPYLEKEGYQMEYIGSRDGIERQLMEPLMPYHGISSGKLRRYFDWKNFTDPFRVIKGYFDALGALRRIRPQIVFSKGGFVAVPVVLAASTLRIPVVIHESDYTSGLANRICLPFAKCICTTFPETAQAIGEKAVCTGTPLRDSLFQGDRERARERFNLRSGKPVLLIMGGSLGAQAVNACVRETLPSLLAEYDVLHLCGAGNLDTSLAGEGFEGYRQYEYISDELPDAFALADCLLSRAGAGSIYEILALRKPALLIPYPKTASRGDQILNAESFERRGLAHVLFQEDMNGETLLAALSSLREDSAGIIRRMEQEPSREGAAAVVQQLLRYQ